MFFKIFGIYLINIVLSLVVLNTAFYFFILTFLFGTYNMVDPMDVNFLNIIIGTVIKNLELCSRSS